MTAPPYFLLESLPPAVPDLLELARNQGTTTSLDPNWDPARTGRPVSKPRSRDSTASCRTWKRRSRSQAADRSKNAVTALAERIGTVAVRLGAEGAYARSGDTEATAPAVAVDVVDSVGAGDNFSAGFLAARLTFEVERIVPGTIHRPLAFTQVAVPRSPRGTGTAPSSLGSPIATASDAISATRRLAGAAEAAAITSGRDAATLSRCAEGRPGPAAAIFAGGTRPAAVTRSSPA